MGDQESPTGSAAPLCPTAWDMGQNVPRRAAAHLNLLERMMWSETRFAGGAEKCLRPYMSYFVAAAARCCWLETACVGSLGIAAIRRCVYSC
jgi:hypothetical protein